MKTIYYFLIIGSCLFIHSCAVYTPNAVNAPMLKEKGDLALGVHVGNGGNLQAAYAVSPHLAVMANLMKINNEVTSLDIIKKGQGHLYEAGLGYFRSNGKSVFDCYGGVGFGHVNIDKDNNNLQSHRNFNADATRIFFQPTIGIAGRNIEIGLSTRVCFLKYRNVSTTYTIDDLTEDSFVDIDRPTWLFIEPALTLRAGFEKVKFQLQLGRSFKTNSQGLGYDAGIFNMGIFARL